MKRTALSGLLLSAALLASPVFAAEDLCSINIGKIEDAKVTAGALSENSEMNIDNVLKDAKAAKDKGDDKECIGITSKALERLDKLTKGGQ